MEGSVVRHANISPSKRSFEEAGHCGLESYRQHYDAAQVTLTSVGYHARTSTSHLRGPPQKKRSISFSPSNHAMLTDRQSIMSGSFPSFMSVFGSDDNSSLYKHVIVDEQSKGDEDAFGLSSVHNTSTQSHQQPPLHKPWIHRGSVSSLFSDSTESSPTTSNSTFDSPVISDNSAASSPESASSLVTASQFQILHKPTNSRPMLSSPGMGDQKMTDIKSELTTTTTTENPKNVKKLTLDMDLPTLRRPTTSLGIGTSSLQPLSAPTSPLKEPSRSARKKPTNLTIRTPGFNQISFAQAQGPSNNAVVPPTPSQRPALHQYQSSPALSLLASPTGPPAGGMFLPIPAHNQFSQNSSSSNGSSSINTSLSDLREEESHQLLKSQETPDRGYTDGPVQIYDSGVYLYLEPTSEEASNFDTVINVAKEVKNPFRKQPADKNTVMSVWRSEPNSTVNEVPEPQTAVSEVSFKSAFEWPVQQPQAVDKATTPTTPTQSSFDSKPKYPEYLHVTWDHNSEILEDLFPLCQFIDRRTEEGKKVLIHCQLGVSRSASLIIAYGLYKGYQPDFHSMYMAVKDRSKWVGPNMSLIYQLTDFRRNVSRGDYASKISVPRPEWFEKLGDGGNTPIAPVSAPASSVLNAASTALVTAAQPEPRPLQQTVPQPSSNPTLKRTPTPLRLNKALPPVPPFPKPSASTPTIYETPASTPLSTQAQPASGTVKRAASRPLPLRERSTEMAIPAHKPRALPGITLPQSSSRMDLAQQDVPQTPSLFSPRATEFMASPFGIRGAGDLSLAGSRTSMDLSQDFSWLPLRRPSHIRTASKDPRSPHHQNEPKEIFRQIDDFL